MKSQALLLFLLLLTTSTHAGSLDKLSKYALTSAEKKEFLNDLSKELASQIQETQRPIKVYHYGQRGTLKRGDFNSPPVEIKWGTLNIPRLGNGVTDLKDPKANLNPVELNPPEVITYFKEKAGLIFGPGTSDGAAGAGLYAAVDPIQSESYAGSPWFLLEIEVPAHVKFLTYGGGFIVSKTFFDKWYAGFDWEAENELKIVGYTKFKNKVIVSKEAVMDYPKYKSLWQQTIQELGIQMMPYFWSPYGTRYCQFHNVMGPSANIAFVFINPDFVNIPGTKLNVYVANLEPSPSAEKAAHYQNILDIVELGRLYGLFSAGYEDGQTPQEANFKYIFSKDNPYLNSKPSFSYMYQWNASLNRRSVLIPTLMSEADITKFASAINDYVFTPKESLPTLEIVFNKDAFSKTESTYPQTSGKLYHYINYNAYFEKIILKNAGETEYKRRTQILKSQVYGCDENHPEENINQNFQY